MRVLQRGSWTSEKVLPGLPYRLVQPKRAPVRETSIMMLPTCETQTLEVILDENLFEHYQLFIGQYGGLGPLSTNFQHVLE